jgi:transcriptional regulator with XRE-family HTH domain
MTAKYPTKPTMPKPNTDQNLSANLQAIAAFYRTDGGRQVPQPQLPYEDDADLIEKLVAFRKRHGLSQADFANVYGVDVRNLQNWERGVCTLSTSTRTLLHSILARPADMAGILYSPLHPTAETSRALKSTRVTPTKKRISELA